MKQTIAISIAVAGIAAAASHFWTKSSLSGAAAEAGADEPLYWVAPMDPNYRRDKPGKSPMGMDLIPVYAEESGSAKQSAGTITISPEVENNLGVRTDAVEYRSLSSAITTVGYVQYDEDQLVHVHPRVAGWIEKLYVKAAGDPVKQGQPLYELYSPELVTAQEELVLAINRNNTRLISAAEDRLRALQIDQSLIDEIKKRRRVKQTLTFSAPQSGVVDNLNIREGFYVKPGTTLMSVGTLDNVWVQAEVFERQASLVKVSQAVTMQLDYLPGERWEGEVDYVYPTLDPATRTARVRLRFANRDGLLKPNMFAQVTIHSTDPSQVLTIPREAVIRTGDQDRVVMALGEGRFKSVAVALGRVDSGFAEIREGLNEGERVVSSAQFLLDSESSKSSDFRRMDSMDGTAEEKKAPPKVEWVEATINSIMLDHRMVNVDHGEIETWYWPEMTMDFTVAEAVDMSRLEVGMRLHIEVSVWEGGDYQISAVHIPDAEDGAQDSEPVDHSAMNHEAMSHEEIGQEEMDHSQHSSHSAEQDDD